MAVLCNSNGYLLATESIWLLSFSRINALLCGPSLCLHYVNLGVVKGIKMSDLIVSLHLLWYRISVFFFFFFFFFAHIVMLCSYVLCDFLSLVYS